MPITYAELLSTKEVAALLGISVRQVNRRTGKDFKPVITGPGKTGARLYSKTEIQSSLSSKSFSPNQSSPAVQLSPQAEPAGNSFIAEGAASKLRRMSALPEVKISNIPEIELRHRLRIAREFAGLDQSDIADELGLGRVTVGNYERGVTVPRKLVVNTWAVVTRVDVEWLKNGTDLPGHGRCWHDATANHLHSECHHKD